MSRHDNKPRRLPVNHVAHEVVPGVRTTYFLSEAREAGYEFFGMLFVALLDGGLFAREWRCLDLSKTDMGNTFWEFYALLLKHRAAFIYEDTMREMKNLGLRPEGYRDQVSALKRISNVDRSQVFKFEVLCTRFQLGAELSSETFTKFQIWVVKFFLSRSPDHVIWTHRHGFMYRSIAGKEAYLPYGSAYRIGLPPNSHLVAFPRTDRNGTDLADLGLAIPKAEIDKIRGKQG